MSFSENTSDSDWKETKIEVARHIKRTTASNQKQKYSQKFCEKWLSAFDPWLTRTPDDSNKPYCRVCRCRLDCNRCHLERHERTRKHKRNLESFFTNGEVSVQQKLTVRQERSKYYYQRKRAQLLKESSVKNEDKSATVKGEEEMVESRLQPIVKNEFCNITPQIDTVANKINSPSVVPEAYVKVTPTTTTPTFSRRNSTSQKEGLKILRQIHQDKNELVESFRELMGSQLNHVPPKEKNHVDLFFESVSSSVKALSPELIAEAKMRVSQLICELELRGLKDNSVHESLISQTQPERSIFISKHSADSESHIDKQFS